MLTTQEEAQLLQNLLTDDDDWVSRRLLKLHYEAQNASVARINTTSVNGGVIPGQRGGVKAGQ